MRKGKIHSIESLGTFDGPGIRTVVFMQGCNMKCFYCHNRDSWDSSGGRHYSVDDLVSAILPYRDYYGDEGGVTFSGGEPLLQSVFLRDVVFELKKKGINIAIDTSGSVFNSHSLALFEIADLIILDIKHIERERYRQICSFSGESSFSNLEYLQNSKKDYWIRQVIVSGHTDSDSSAEELGQILNYKNRPGKIELLPYHDMGREKWIAEGGKYHLEGFRAPTHERMDQLNRRLYSSFTESRK